MAGFDTAVVATALEKADQMHERMARRILLSSSPEGLT